MVRDEPKIATQLDITRYKMPQSLSRPSPSSLMVDTLLRPYGVLAPRVVEAFRYVDRKDFVPKDKAYLAYADAPVPLDSLMSQAPAPKGTPAVPTATMLAPQITGLMLHHLNPQPMTKVLVVSCGTGYTCALLDAMGCKVVGMDSDDALFHHCQRLAKTTGLKNCKFVRSNLTDGFVEWAPYDHIVFDGAISYLHTSYTDQLRRGGSIVCILQNAQMPSVARMMILKKNPQEHQALPEVLKPRTSISPHDTGKTFGADKPTTSHYNHDDASGGEPTALRAREIKPIPTPSSPVALYDQHGFPHRSFSSVDQVAELFAQPFIREFKAQKKFRFV